MTAILTKAPAENVVHHKLIYAGVFASRQKRNALQIEHVFLASGYDRLGGVRVLDGLTHCAHSEPRVGFSWVSHQNGLTRTHANPIDPL